MNGEVHGEGGGSPAERFWEGYYGERERVCSGRANPLLVDVAGALALGGLLLLGGRVAHFVGSRRFAFPRPTARCFGAGRAWGRGATARPLDPGHRA